MGDWELIHGVPLAMAPSSNVRHQQLSMAIARQLDEALDGCPSGQALFEIDVEPADDTVVRPDVLVICYQPGGDRLTRFRILWQTQTHTRRWRDCTLDFWTSPESRPWQGGDQVGVNPSPKPAIVSVSLRASRWPAPQGHFQLDPVLYPYLHSTDRSCRQPTAGCWYWWR